MSKMKRDIIKMMKKRREKGLNLSSRLQHYNFDEISQFQ